MKSHTIFALCAEWCGVCREFRTHWNTAAATDADTRYVWIDVEDEADRLGDLDIETFPTIAIAQGTTPLFFGVTLPSMPAVTRLTSAGLSPDALPDEHKSLIGLLLAEFPSQD